MTYRAKKPRKRRLTVKIEKCWHISIVDENDYEVDYDYCFGARKYAEQAGENMLRNAYEAQKKKERLEGAISEARKVKQAVRSGDAVEWDNESMRSVARNAVESVFFAMNENGGAK